VAAHVAQHETEQVVCVRIIGRELDRALERVQRFVVEATVVEHLSNVELDDGASGVERQCAREPSLRVLQVTAPLLRQPELHQRADVVRVEAQQLAELRDGIVHLTEQRVRAAELPPGVTVVGPQAKAVLELRDPSVVVAGIEVRDLEVALRNLHLGVELQRARERGHGFA
jgi:hypothetical protein